MAGVPETDSEDDETRERGEDRNRGTRQMLRELADDAMGVFVFKVSKARRSALIQPGSDEMPRMMERADALAKHVKRTSEAVLDTQILRVLAEDVDEQAKRLHARLRQYDPVDFVARLLHQFQDRDGTLDLYKYAQGAQLMRYVRRTVTPEAEFMYGALNIEPSEKRRRVQQRLGRSMAVAPVVHPDIAPENATASSATETDRRIEVLNTTLQKEAKTRREAPFWTFLAHPTSFGQTVENLFDMSFLVKDGHAKLETNERRELLVTSARPPNARDLEERKGYAKGMILKLTMDDWKSTVRNLGLSGRPPLVPDRTLQEEEEEEEERHEQPPTARRQQPDET